MMSLDDFAPSRREEKLTSGMPEQVRIGYIRAMRKANHGRRLEDDLLNNDSPTITGLFGNLFNQRGDGNA